MTETKQQIESQPFNRFLKIVTGGSQICLVAAVAAGAWAAEPAIPSVSVFVNQAGYNLGEAKRFTCPRAADGTPFQIRREATAEALFSGVVQKQVGDFSGFNPVTAGEQYVVVVEGQGQSVPFWIADHLMEKVSSRLAYQFFIDVRGTTDPKGDAGKITGGGPSRDGGGQTLEATYELLLYASNPALFDRWASEMKVARTPDLIALALWHAAFCFHNRHYNGTAGGYEKWVRTFGYKGQPAQKFDYQNMLDQLAAVCGAYDEFLKPHLDTATFQQYRSTCLEFWEKYDRHKEVRYFVDSRKWIDSGYREFSEQGNAFGQGLLRNLFMYLCEKRRPDGQPERFLKHAQACATDIVQNWNFDNEWHMWALRNAEHITPQALALFLMVAPEQAPPGAREKLAAWRDYIVRRTDNLWNYRTHSDTEWAHPQSKEVGTVAGLGGSMFAVAAVLDDPALRRIGWSQVDFVFGRNPIGGHLSNKSPERLAKGGYWDGVEHGWPWHLKNGTGKLGPVRGTLDGSPINAMFPFKPDAPPAKDMYYHTEGWAISNRGWLSTVAFATLGSHRLRVLNAAGQPITAAKLGDTVTIELRAALNQDWLKADTGWVNVAVGNLPAEHLTVTETGPNTGLFTARYQLPASAGRNITFSYGYLGFTKSAKLTTE